MKKLLITPILLIALALSGYANSSENKRETIKEVLSLLKSESIITSMHQQIMGTLRNQVESNNIQSSEREILERYMSNVLAILESSVTWEKVEPYMIDIYDKTYTEEELLEMERFYKTKTGQKIINNIPAIMQRSAVMSQEIINQVSPLLNKETESLIEELQAKRSQ